MQQKEEVLAHNRFFRLAAVAVLVGLFLSAGTAGSALGAPGGAKAGAAKRAKPLSKKAKQKLRARLRKELKRNPARALSPSFLKLAALSEFHMPLSVRLSRSDGLGGFEASDDVLEIAWDDSAFTWPLTAGMIAAPQDVPVSGGFTMEAVFGGGDTTGYAEPGAMETILGGAIKMDAGPFTISEFSTPCGSGPQLTTDPANRVQLTSAGARWGLVNLFSNDFSGTLSLRMTFAGSVAASCGATPALTPTVDNSAAAPDPVRMQGEFDLSPAITPDGNVRFGRITVDDTVTPQLSTFGYVRSCTGTSTCDPMLFPARFKMKKLTAEVLLGDVLP